MKNRVLLLACLASCVCSFAAAQGDAKGGTVDFNDFKPTKIVTPIFSEILVLPFPEGFVGASARTHNDFYINEMVLKGETADHWSQMITQTGRKGMSLRQNVTPEGYISAMAGGFKRACPDTFFSRGLGATTISGHDAFVAFVSCGTVSSEANAHSESTLFVCIKGTEDYYTLQWAERGPASGQPIVYDEAKWGERLKKLSSVQTTPVAPAEATPNPSGGDRK
jgi:hypothetical protein